MSTHNLHPSAWTTKQLMNYCVEHKLYKEELIGSLTKEKLVELVVADEIDKE